MSETVNQQPHPLATILESIRRRSFFQRSHNYVLLHPLSKVPFSSRYRTAIKAGIIAFVLVLLALIIAPYHPVDTARDYGILNPLGIHDPIPSTVHFVYIKTGEDAKLEFNFAAFLSVFSSILFVKPSKVYVHTDFSTREIEYAAQYGTRWTRKLLNSWPGLIVWNPVHVASFSGPNDNNRIDAVQHKSDFIRWETIAKYGGVYMDFDVIVLKSLAPLMNAGFGFVAGRQYGGKDEGGQINGTINNGAFLTKRNSAMSTLVRQEQHAGFNGAWEANLQSMTKTAEYLVNIPNQVLILDRNAFAPTHWFPESTDALFIPNEGPASPIPLDSNSADPIELYDIVVQNRRSRREWEMDFSATYMLHAFATGKYSDRINPRTILSRTSNYGIATYHVVKAMVEHGLVNGTEEDSDDDSS